MTWVATPSPNFTARHAEAHADEALTVLEALETHRASMEEVFPRIPERVTVVLHDSTTQLMLAQPLLALARRMSAPDGRRYMAGWFAQGEVHCLAPSVLRRTAAGDESLKALMLTPQRYYTMLVVGINNPLLPPPFRPPAVMRLLRRAWQAAGAAQHFSGQVPLLRAAIAVRLRRGPAKFPPTSRDAALLGGTVFDLLHARRGTHACVRLACHPDNADERTVLESAFDAPRHELTQAWRAHLERLASPEPHVTTFDV